MDILPNFQRIQHKLYLHFVKNDGKGAGGREGSLQKANEFKSGIWVEKEERRVNAKSLLGVLSLGIIKGTVITLIADGPDEKEAVTALKELIENNFGE